LSSALAKQRLVEFNFPVGERTGSGMLRWLGRNWNLSLLPINNILLDLVVPLCQHAFGPFQAGLEIDATQDAEDNRRRGGQVSPFFSVPCSTVGSPEPEEPRGQAATDKT